MDAVSLGNKIVVLAADAVNNIGFPVHGINSIFSRKAFDLVLDLGYFFFGNELGELNAIHQHSPFVRFKGRVLQYPFLYVLIVFQMKIKDIIQNCKVTIQGLLLYWKALFSQVCF